MNLPLEDCGIFYKLYSALLSYTNQKLKVVPETFATSEQYTSLPAETRMKVRDALHAHKELIEQFVRENPANLAADELEIVSSWRHALVGGFYILRCLKRYAVFLDEKSPPKAYGVVALADSFEEVVGPGLPLRAEAVLLPFKGRIIYDGLLHWYHISFGPNIRQSINERYRQAKEIFGIITSLSAGGEPQPEPKKKGRPKKRESAKIKRRLEEVLESILCPIAGCWCLHGAETAYYFDHGCECHVLEVWPVGWHEPEEPGGNGRKRPEGEICYEFAEFGFTELLGMPLENFHFSQRRAIFDIGWREFGQDLELRIHIEPAEAEETREA